MSESSNRREWLKTTAGAAAAIAGGAAVSRLDGAVMGSGGVRIVESPLTPVHGKIKQSASRWCYQRMPLPELCRNAKRIGLVGIDLLQRADWPVVADAGLTVTMGYAADRRDFLTNGFTNRASHPMLIKELVDALPEAKKAKVPNLIAMFGNRAGRTDSEAIGAAIVGLRQVAPVAEENGVTICVELLNSKVDHKDYHGDRTEFGVEVMKGVNSTHVKLLYDIYHMQIMEGDVIRTIRQNAQWIGHYHTGGVPGRNEIDDTQELNWAAVMRAIHESKYEGFVAHEFLPKRDPMTSLEQAFKICDID